MVLHEMRQGVRQVINVRRLRGRMVEREVTMEQLAKHLGIDRATLYRKFKDESGHRLSVREAQEIARLLGLSTNDITGIFFEGDVA